MVPVNNVLGVVLSSFAMEQASMKSVAGIDSYSVSKCDVEMAV